MRIKAIVSILVLTSLTCTANVTVFNTTPTAPVGPIPTAVIETTQAVSALTLENRPVIVPNGISAIHMLDFPNGWMVTDDAVLRTGDGGQTWTIQVP